MIKELEQRLREAASPEIANKQSAYMRHQFSFLGVQKPIRTGIQKEIFRQYPIHSEAELIKHLHLLWRQQAREFKYTAMDLSKKYRKLWSPAILDDYKVMILSDPWWDTVDLIASSLVGALLRTHTSLIKKMDVWIQDESLWIRRSALLYQLLYKEQTDEKRLFQYIRKTMHEQDFFMRKAIGWALRQYAKTNPVSVRNFVKQERSSLSALSIREATKYL